MDNCFHAVLYMLIHTGMEQEFEDCWLEIARNIARQPANRSQRLMRSTEDPSAYFVLTEWADEASFRQFERSDAHIENRARLDRFRAEGKMTTMSERHTL